MPPQEVIGSQRDPQRQPANHVIHIETDWGLNGKGTANIAQVIEAAGKEASVLFKARIERTLINGLAELLKEAITKAPL